MPNAEHVTTDIYLAAFLVHRGRTLLHLRRVGPKAVEFRFAADRQLHNLLRLYWSGAMTLVAPWELFAALHRLRCRSIVRDK